MRSPHRPRSDWEWRNPVGTGYRGSGRERRGTAATECRVPQELIGSWNDRPPPAGFGAIDSHWQPRAGFAGTYDDHWVKTRQPLLAEDFDDRLFQCAPADQQAPAFLRGGEAVILHNLTPEAHCGSRCLRSFSALRPASIDGGREMHKARRLHTVIFEPDYPRVSLVWHRRCRATSRCRSSSGPIVTVEGRTGAGEPGAGHSDRRTPCLSAGRASSRRWAPRRRSDATPGRAPPRSRAGISGFTEHPYITDTEGEPMRVAMAPWLEPGARVSTGSRRCLFPALEQAVGTVRRRSWRRRRNWRWPSDLPSLDAGAAGRHGRAALGAHLPPTRGPIRGDRDVSSPATPPASSAARRVAARGDRRIRCVRRGWGGELRRAGNAAVARRAANSCTARGRSTTRGDSFPAKRPGPCCCAARRHWTACGSRRSRWCAGLAPPWSRTAIKTETVCIGEGLTAAFRPVPRGPAAGGGVSDVIAI